MPKVARNHKMIAWQVKSVNSICINPLKCSPKRSELLKRLNAEYGTTLKLHRPTTWQRDSARRLSDTFVCMYVQVCSSNSCSFSYTTVTFWKTLAGRQAGAAYEWVHASTPKQLGTELNFYEVRFIWHAKNTRTNTYMCICMYVYYNSFSSAHLLLFYHSFFFSFALWIFGNKKLKLKYG